MKISNKLLVLGMTSLFSMPLLAGSLDSPAAPTDASSAMYTLEDIYNRLDTGATAVAPTGGFTEPVSGPGATGHTLTEVYQKADAAMNKVGVPKTGQTKCYDASSEQTCSVTGFPGQDGDHQKGVTTATRFNDNGDGTVTDNLTGLIWLTNANCASATRTWQTALTDVEQLNTNGTMNSNDCGDTSNSNSHQTDWRLPNVKELQSLIDFSQNSPALPSGQPFSGVQASVYWSSTSAADDSTNAWYVFLDGGDVFTNAKLNSVYVWPVRGGQ
jgi:hypothetical protein